MNFFALKTIVFSLNPSINSDQCLILASTGPGVVAIYIKSKVTINIYCLRFYSICTVLLSTDQGAYKISSRC